jgi:transposase InsO family protein
VSEQTAQATIIALEILFLLYRPPLVLRSDNGSAFVSDAFQAFLACHRVQWLPSPPRKPWYTS